MSEVLAGLQRVRAVVQRAFDLGAWVLGFVSMAWLQAFVGYSSLAQQGPALVVGLGCGLAFVILAVPVRLHDGRSRIGSFDDVLWVGALSAVVSLVALLVNLYRFDVRVSVSVTGPMCAVVLLLVARALFRLFRDWTLRLASRTTEDQRTRVVVIGAGDGASQLVGDMMLDPSSIWRPVALLDDDPRRRHRRVHGVPVVGPTAGLEKVAKSLKVQTAVLAIPSASAGLVQEFNGRARRAGLDLKVLPSVNDLSNPAHVQIEDVRDIEVSDFLGRQPVETDVAAIADYLTGRKVLVTGAGGSIGSELCRQIARFDPADLVMLDRDESALHAVQLSIHGRALLDSDEVVLGDIRDQRFVREVFERRRPDVVFHAAALKHLPLLEAAPGEAVKTNVWGTQTVLESAVAVGVERFVNISTDKAANPACVLGHSKRLAEGLTSLTARSAGGRFMSVRFGNVLGSRGSVLTTFAAQIARGGPVTVTDPHVTRYFMTIGEAVQLVIQAGAIGDRGDALILDMGQPVPISAVAQQLIDLAGKPVEIVYTGLRQGEKLHEDLFNAGEVDDRPQHPLISQAPVPAYSPDDAAQLRPYGPRQELIRLLESETATMSAMLADGGDRRVGRAPGRR